MVPVMGAQDVHLPTYPAVLPEPGGCVGCPLSSVFTREASWSGSELQAQTVGCRAQGEQWSADPAARPSADSTLPALSFLFTTVRMFVSLLKF